MQQLQVTVLHPVLTCRSIDRHVRRIDRRPDEDRKPGDRQEKREAGKWQSPIIKQRQKSQRESSGERRPIIAHNPCPSDKRVTSDHKHCSIESTYRATRGRRVFTGDW